jgi:predicted restriction endonuclease
VPILHACLTCGKLTPNTRCPKHAKAKRRKRCARQDASRRARGVPQGERRVPRAIRAKVLARFGARCAFVVSKGRCPATERLEVHHMDGNPTNNDLANLILLCAKHHRAAEGRRSR